MIEILVGMNRNLILLVNVVFIVLIWFNFIMFVYNVINNSISLIIEVGIGIGINDLIIFDISKIIVIVNVCWKILYFIDFLLLIVLFLMRCVCFKIIIFFCFFYGYIIEWKWLL